MVNAVAKKVLRSVDNQLGTGLYKTGATVNSAFWNSGCLVRIQSAICAVRVRWNSILPTTDHPPLKLHLGCGNRHLARYVNIDCRKTSATDLVCDIRRLPYRENSAETIECYHVLEHVPVCLMANIDHQWGERYSSIVALLREWNRILKTNGLLIIEVPDFDAIIEEYTHADEGRREELLVHIYGGYRSNNIHDVHRWGVNKYRLRYILERAGFRDITFKDPQDYHGESCPCLRVEATK